MYNIFSHTRYQFWDRRYFTIYVFNLFPHISACSSAKKLLNFCLVTVGHSRVTKGFIVGSRSAKFFFLYRILSELIYLFFVDLFNETLKTKILFFAKKIKKKSFIFIIKTGICMCNIFSNCP